MQKRFHIILLLEMPQEKVLVTCNFRFKQNAEIFSGVLKNVLHSSIIVTLTSISGLC